MNVCGCWIIYKDFFLLKIANYNSEYLKLLFEDRIEVLKLSRFQGRLKITTPVL